MVDSSFDRRSLPSLKAILRGIQLFVAFTTIGIIVAALWKSPVDPRALIKYIDPRFVALIIPLVAVDYLLGGYRYRLFFDGRVLPKISFLNCIRSNWANIFLGVITPFQTGGGPAQIYLLWRHGAKISQAMLVGLINLAATLLFFLVASFAVIVVLPAGLFNKLMPLIHAAFITVGSVLSLVLLSLVFPNLVIAATRRIFAVVPARLKRLHNLKNRIINKLDSEIHQFQGDFALILRRQKARLAIDVIATLALFFNKYLIGYVIALSLHQSVPFRTFIGLQILQLFLIYFAPTPGASGVAELSSTWLLGGLLARDTLVFFAVTWRFFTTMLGAMLGGYVLIRDLKRWEKETSHPPPPG